VLERIKIDKTSPYELAPLLSRLRPNFGQNSFFNGQNRSYKSYEYNSPVRGLDIETFIAKLKILCERERCQKIPDRFRLRDAGVRSCG